MILLLLACEGPDPTPDDSAADPCGGDLGIEVGSGATAFEPLADGDPLTMVHGPQGGWHMLGSVRATATTPNLTVHYTIRDNDSGVIVSDNTYRVGLVNDGECAGYYPGMYGYLYVDALAVGDLDTPPELLGGHTLVLEMEASSTDDRSAVAQRAVTAVLDERDQGSDTGL